MLTSGDHLCFHPRKRSWSQWAKDIPDTWGEEPVASLVVENLPFDTGPTFCCCDIVFNQKSGVTTTRTMMWEHQ